MFTTKCFFYKSGSMVNVFCSIIVFHFKIFLRGDYVLSNLLNLSGIITSFLAAFMMCKDYLFSDDDTVYKNVRSESIAYYEEEIDSNPAFKNKVRLIVKQKYNFLLLAVGFVFQIISIVLHMLKIDVSINTNTFVLLTSLLASLVLFFIIEIVANRKAKKILLSKL